MKTPVPCINKSTDHIQKRLTDYACELNYELLSPNAIHAAKVRVIDTLGALIAGFFSESCQIARKLAAQAPDPYGATVIGTRTKAIPDMAAFVNALTARDAEMMDFYHWPGSFHGHPSDVLMPILAVAEHGQSNGREFITSVVLAYEVYCRTADVFRKDGFDPLNFASLGIAVAAGKLLRLPPTKLSHCISMAVVPNNILHQVRTDHLSMFKVAASGQAGRAGVFSALLARAGMEGPHLPFEGSGGWCDHVAGIRFSLDTLGRKDTPLKILDTQIKRRPAAAPAISAILAAEKVAPLNNAKDVKLVTVEVYKWAQERNANERARNPGSREDADHSIPFVVAATLIDGTVTQRSFNDAHLWNPELRALMRKIEVVENEQFTKAFERLPVAHCARVTVVTSDGQQLVGESGDDQLAEQVSDEEIARKFRGFTEDLFGVRRVDSILDRLWNLEDSGNVAEIPPAFILD